MKAILQKDDAFQEVDECTDFCIGFIDESRNYYFERSGEYNGMPLFIYKGAYQ